MRLKRDGTVEVFLMLRYDNSPIYLSIEITHEILLAHVAYLIVVVFRLNMTGPLAQRQCRQQQEGARAFREEHFLLYILHVTRTTCSSRRSRAQATREKIIPEA